MLGARPPLAHSVSGGLEDELHAQYSMIAVVVLSALFFTVTVSATGLLLAFCKKSNAVFSLQKSEQDSHLEMDDLDKTDTESACQGEDVDPSLAGATPSSSFSAGSSASRRQKRSRTFPELFGLGSPCPEAASIEASESSGSLDSRSPLMPPCSQARERTPMTSLRTELKGGVGCRGDSDRRSSITRSVTVAAIHHNTQHADGAGNSSVTVHLEGFDSRSELSGSAFGHLYLKLQEEEEEVEKSREGDRGDSDVDDDLHSDQTRALLR